MTAASRRAALSALRAAPQAATDGAAQPRQLAFLAGLAGLRRVRIVIGRGVAVRRRRSLVRAPVDVVVGVVARLVRSVDGPEPVVRVARGVGGGAGPRALRGAHVGAFEDVGRVKVAQKRLERGDARGNDGKVQHGLREDAGHDAAEGRVPVACRG